MISDFQYFFFVLQEAIVSRGLHTDKTPYHKLNMDDALSGGPSFVSVDSRASDFMSEGDLSLPNASAQLSSYTESAGAAGITWTKIEKKHKWDVQSWTQGLLRRAERIASDSEPTRSVAVVRMKPLTELQQEVPTATTSTYGSDEDEKQLRLDSRGVDHLNQADSLSNVKSTSLRVDTQAASTGGATSKNMLIGSESVSASRGTRSPTRQAEAPGRSGPAAVSPLWGSETGKSRRAGARKPAAVYRPPAWELTSSHLRKFQETSLPIVRFDKVNYSFHE